MVKLERYLSLVCMLIGGPLMLTGCALRMPAYPVQPATSYANRTSQNAVDVAIHPITSTVESKKYFGTNLISRNVLAILVVVDNHSDASLVLDASQCELVGLPDRASDDQLPGKTAGEVVGVVSIATISLAGGVLSMKMMNDSENIKSNLHVKELRRQTVSPGNSVQGFLYFRLPDRDSSKEAQTRWHVKIAVSKLGAAATTHARLTFNWKR